MQITLIVLNVIGTVAFAVSGALTAIRKEMDLLGVTILGMITAVGGGIIRDVIMGSTPPAAFIDPKYALIACGTSVAVFGISYFKTKAYQKTEEALFQSIILAADTLGLAMFTVIGVQTAFEHHAATNLFLSVFLGTITGVGGGIIRDILAQDRPYIFHKHVYACASIIGALLCTVLWEIWGSKIAMLVGAFAVVIIRALAARFKWNLPKIKGVTSGRLTELPEAAKSQESK